VRIYIDEAGNFLAPRSRPWSFSLILALVIPSSLERELFHEFLLLRDSWPNQAIEIKGSSLNEAQAGEVIKLLMGYDVIVEFMALDMATHPNAVVSDFKDRQANKMTSNLTREHDPEIVQEATVLATEIRNMANQLFLQSFLTIKVIIETIQTSTLYYALRKPEELGEICWTIDRKNRTMTQMEKLWTTLILPVSEGHYARTPLVYVVEADYSHFARYEVDTSLDKDMASHAEWMQNTYGGPAKRVGPGSRVVDAKRLLTEQRTFEDSRKSLGLQLADMLASILRRALNDSLQYEGWKDFGRLLVRNHELAPWFKQLGQAEAPEMLQGHAKKVGEVLLKNVRAMFPEDS
jgi:hypothetical protein